MYPRSDVYALLRLGNDCDVSASDSHDSDDDGDAGTHARTLRGDNITSFHCASDSSLNLS